MRQAILLPALLGLTLLSGCGGPGGEAGIRESGKSGSATVAASYIPLAECVHDDLERKEWGYARVVMPPTLNVLQHRNMAKLSWSPNGTALAYLIEIQGAGEQSDVTVHAYNIGFMFSGEETVEELIGVVRNCVV